MWTLLPVVVNAAIQWVGAEAGRDADWTVRQSERDGDTQDWAHQGTSPHTNWSLSFSVMLLLLVIAFVTRSWAEIYFDHFYVNAVWQLQWQRQRSKGARSFRGQKILQPGHPDALFSTKKVDNLFLVVALKHRPPMPFYLQNKTNKAVIYVNILIFCSHYYWSKAIHRARQDGGSSNQVVWPGTPWCSAATGQL